MPSRPSEIQCPHYAAAPHSRTCASFVSGGGCTRPDIFMCTEWVRKNPTRGASTLPTMPSPPTATSVPGDLFGDGVRAQTRPAPEPPAPRKSLPIASAKASEQPFTRPITEEQIKTLEERGLELCVRTEAAGELWLVPAYTGSERNEMTFRDAATIAALCAVFPGAELTQFRSGSTTSKSQ